MIKKLFIGVAALAFSQLSHAIPIISGASDIASNDGETYYGLIATDSSWEVRAYDASGKATGESVTLSPNKFVTPDLQHYVGLAYDGSNFYVLRDDSRSATEKFADSYTIAGFNAADGSFNGYTAKLGPNPYVVPSKQSYVGLDIAKGAFIALRDDSASSTEKFADSWTAVGFDMNGQWNQQASKFEERPSAVPYVAMAGYANSPLVLEPSTNAAAVSVPEPGTGLLLSTLLLGFFARKLKRA